MSHYNKRKLKTYDRNKIPKKRFKKTKMNFFIQFVIILYMVISIVSFIKTEKIKYIIADEGYINTAETFKGIITRNEKLVVSPVSGIIEYLYPEGEKLKKNTIVCHIKDKYYENIIENKLDLLNNEINRTKSDFDVKSSYIQDIYVMDRKIIKSLDTFLLNKEYNDFEDIYNIKNQLLDLIKRRNDIYIIENNKKLYKLLTTKQEYDKQMKLSYTNVSTDNSGLIAYAYDGYENLKYDQIDKNFLDNYKNKLSTIKIDRKLIKKQVPIFKFINNNDWYITLFINTKAKENFTKNKKVKIKLDGNENYLFADVIQIKKLDNKTNKITLKLTNQINKYLNQRIVDITLEEKNIKGIKIPNTALIIKDFYYIPNSCIFKSKSLQGVLKVTENGEVFVPIDIVYKDDSYIYFGKNDEQLNINDKLVIKTDNNNQKTYILENVIKLQGVYIINNGYKRFKKIDIQYQNEDYSIISQTSPYGVQLYDRISQNAD